MTDSNRSKALWGFTAFLVVCAILFFFYWLFYLRFHQYTDDAYANGSMVTINSVVQGSVDGFYADDTDFVQEGQLLVSLDKTAYQIAYDKEWATLASVVLQVSQLYDSVKANSANFSGKQIAWQRAQYDFENREKLVDSKAISHEEFTHSKEALQTAFLEMEQAEAEWKVTLDAVGNSPIETHPLIEKQKEAVRKAYYDLQHCSIYAPATGYVAKRSVNVGQSVTNTTPLMALIPADYVWVDANFKETQLKKMRIGQPATVWLDIYGSKVKYEGKVVGIASGTGSVFSLIPPQNATGNWIKIVQRLPVRISLDKETLKRYPTRLGLSAEVDVDIRNQELPMLAPSPAKKVVAKTTVFEIDLETVNALIESIVKENLRNG